jgi:TonB family protein
MGNSRAFLIVAVLVSTVLRAGAAGGPPQAAKASPLEINPSAIPEMQFYLAGGEADACGPGCSEWIAAEGNIDLGAAPRLRRLLAKLGARRPPIYFHSPGGAVVGSLALGRLIRERKLHTSVAHTVPFGCDRDKPFAKPCEALKRSGQELRSEFDPSRAMCNSACVYALIGGAVRIIPAGIKLGIHDVGLDPARAPLPAGLSARVKSLVHYQIQEYLREMGIDSALYAAILAVPNNSRRFLQREELARFGIDRRESGETPWEFFGRPGPAVWKRFFLRVETGRPQYIDGVLMLACASGPEIRIGVARDHGSDAAAARLVSVRIGERRIDLPYQVASNEYYARSARLAADTFAALGDDTTFAIAGVGPARADGAGGDVILAMEGFSRAYAKLKGSCAPAPMTGRLNVGTSNYDPSSNPNCRPGGDALKCLQGDARLRSSRQSPPPNVLPSVASGNVVRTVPIRPDESHEQKPSADPVPPASPAVLGWKRALFVQIARNQRYPADANGEQGTAIVAFQIDRSGHLVESRIVRSSGSAVLDAASLALVRGAQPFPAPPADAPDAQLSFTLPIHHAAPLADRR